MNKRWWVVSMIGLVTILLCGASLFLHDTAAENHAGNQPVSYGPPADDGSFEKKRIGYIEGEPYVNFAGTLHALVVGLEELGWLENAGDLPYVTGQEDSAVMWEWLVQRDTGPYIEFVADAHYSLLGADYTAQDVVTRMQQDADIDLMIVMGTVAGQALATTDHQVPVLNFSSSNAVQAGIIASTEDSGMDHVWAHMDPDRYKRQVEVFYDIFGFERLGMLYEDSEVGRVYAAIEDVRGVATERGFHIEQRYVDEASDPMDMSERYYPEVKRKFEELAQVVDAMYLTVGTWELEALPELLEPFFEHQIPVFSQLGTEEVAHGALISVARPDFMDIGRYGASVIGRIFNGDSPRQLEQEFGHTPTIVLNLEVAELIGYEAPFDILLVADEIHQRIEGHLPAQLRERTSSSNVPEHWQTRPSAGMSASFSVNGEYHK